MFVVIPVEWNPSKGGKVRSFIGKTVIKLFASRRLPFLHLSDLKKAYMVPVAFQGKLIYLHNF